MATPEDSFHNQNRDLTFTMLPEGRRRAYSLIIPLLGLVLSFLFATCKDMGTEPGDLGRIVLGESIEGVRIGDTADRVEQILGTPYSKGSVDVVEGGYEIWAYYFGPPTNSFAHLEVGFAASTPDGPVRFLWVHPGYQGKTREGLGIGSPLGEVLGNLGTPVRATPSSTFSTYYFCCRNVIVRFVTRDETVVAIAIGPPGRSSYYPSCE